MTEKLYLAYGSNCSINQMSDRCNNSEFVGLATVDGFRLIYRRGYLTIAPEEQNSIICAVWKLEGNDERKLDYYEGFPYYYGKYYIPATMQNDRKINALIYIMSSIFDEEYMLPTNEYINICMQGYKDCKMDITQLTNAYCEIEEKISRSKKLICNKK